MIGDIQHRFLREFRSLSVQNGNPLLPSFYAPAFSLLGLFRKQETAAILFLSKNLYTAKLSYPFWELWM